MQNQILNIATAFLNNHTVSTVRPDVLPSWHTMLLVDGTQTSTAGLKKLISPIVLAEVGAQPRALKSVVWKVLVQASKNQNNL